MSGEKPATHPTQLTTVPPNRQSPIANRQSPPMPRKVLTNYALIDRKAKGGGGAARQQLDWTDPEGMDEDVLAAFISAQYEDAKQRRSCWEGEAAEVLAWARGNQHVYFDPVSDNLVAENLQNLPLWLREPVTINKLRGFVLQQITFYIGAPLTWIVNPATRDDDDVTSARGASKVVRYYFEQGSPTGMKGLIDAAWMFVCTGIVWAKPMFDPYAGAADRFDFDQLGKAVDTATTDESRKVRSAFLDKTNSWVQRFRGRGLSAKEKTDQALDLPAGDLSIDWVPGFDLSEPVHTRQVDHETAWLIHSRFRTIEYLRERYGDIADKLQPDADSEAYRYRHVELYGRTELSSVVQSDEVMVHELWRPRCAAAPVGCLAQMAGNRILKVGPHPTITSRLPFIAFQDAPEPEYFRPRSTVQDLLSLARARNKQRSQLHGHFSATINPVILEEDSAHLPPHAFRQDMPGTLKVADGTIDRVRPFPMPMPPPYAAELDQMNSTDMEDIAGIHRSTSGRAESAQQSGIHAQVLAQGDAQRHRVGRMLFESSAGELGQHLLMLAWEFITQERTISITGDAGERDVVVFKGSDLSKRRPFGPWAFNVTAALAPIEDMAQTVAKLETLLKYQILRPENERDKQLILRWVGERVPAETDDWSYHRSQAAKENAELLAGKPINEAIGDFDAVHVAEHERFTTTEEYKRKVREELSRGDVVASAEGGESQQQAPRQSRTAFAML